MPRALADAQSVSPVLYNDCIRKRTTRLAGEGANGNALIAAEAVKYNGVSALSVQYAAYLCGYVESVADRSDLARGAGAVKQVDGHSR